MKITQILINFVFLIAALSLSTIPAHAALVPGKTIELRFHHKYPGSIVVASVKLLNENPGKYELPIPTYGYSFFINTDNNVNLYRGVVAAYDMTYVDPKNGNAQPLVYGGLIDPLVVYAPYYNDARVVKFQDSASQIQTVELSLYGINTTATPPNRLAGCNVCGFCYPNDRPPNLDACMKCLYPGMSPEQSLVIDKNTNRPPATAIGKYFTQLGCIGSGAKSFRDAAEQGEVLNYLMYSFLVPITGGLALLALIYGAYLLLTSQDNPEQIQRGKSWVYGALIGAIFVFAAVLIVQTIAANILALPTVSK